MHGASFPDLPPQRLHAGIFASDLRQRCEQLFEVFADEHGSGPLDGMVSERLLLPITIPMDEHRLVLLGPATLDCDKEDATMEVVRPLAPGFAYRFGIGLRLLDGRPLLVPGVNPRGDEAEPPMPVTELTFAVADHGFAVVGFGADDQALPLAVSEHTACLLATALLITLGVKLVKAERGAY